MSFRILLVQNEPGLKQDQTRVRTVSSGVAKINKGRR